MLSLDDYATQIISTPSSETAKQLVKDLVEQIAAMTDDISPLAAEKIRTLIYTNSSSL